VKIISFDPGGTTGVATYDSETDEWLHWTWGPHEHHYELDNYLRLYGFHFDVWLYEEFVYQRRDLDKGVSLVLVSLEYIGIIKACHAYWATKEPPVDRMDLRKSLLSYKRLFDDRKLKLCDLWNRPSGAALTAHERDATRHLLYHIATSQDPELQDLGRYYVNQTKR
jgi:hypothetical protein